MHMRLFALFAAGGLGLVSACTRQESAREIDWAKAALARNPAYEIVATDESTGVFTVRSTATGRFETLKLQNLIAAPLPPKVVAQTAPAPAEPVEAPDAAPAATAANQTTAPVEAGSSTEGALAQGPGYSIQRGEAASPPMASTLEGPGYSITRPAITRQESAQAQANPGAEAMASNVERRTDPIICQGDRLMRIDGETIEFSGEPGKP